MTHIIEKNYHILLLTMDQVVGVKGWERDHTWPSVTVNLAF